MAVSHDLLTKFERSHDKFTQVLYGNKDHFGTQAVLAAAEYGGTKLTVKDEAPPTDKVFYHVVSFQFLKFI